MGDPRPFRRMARHCSWLGSLLIRVSTAFAAVRAFCGCITGLRRHRADPACAVQLAKPGLHFVEPNPS